MSKEEETYNKDEQLETAAENEEITFDGEEELEEEPQNDAEEEPSAVEDSENTVVEDSEEDAEQGKSDRKHLIDGLLGEGEINATSFKDLFKNMEGTGEWFRHNLAYILMVTVCMLLFVTNRYQAQQEMIEEARLKNELADMKYKWLTRFSELTTSTRQSQIEERLKQIGDSTLSHSKEAPFIIKASK